MPPSRSDFGKPSLFLAQPVPAWAAGVVTDFIPLFTAPMRKTAIIGFVVGMALGCLFGAVMGVMPDGEERQQQPEMLSVNANTGKPQLHIKGKPEIK